MAWIYVVVDKFGFIGAYDNKDIALDLVNEWKNTVELLIINFPLDDAHQKEEVYFIPYSGLETDSRFPVAFVSNNKDKALAVQTKLVSMEMTYPDDIVFFTKKINNINPVEFMRLTNDHLRIKEALFDSLINKVENADKETLNLPFDQMISGLIWDPLDLLKPHSKEIVNIEEKKNSLI